ncbi:MAG: response regulator [Aulosira sp. ZfuVER01]|nr:response regulator [Aulosira sp. ZfuVER01]MDZ7999418.1 response regulator [Aulosira sp. DedVER01a]MDZ8055397.1 response regulator [Aulosira sp. ZfuCHP01]
MLRKSILICDDLVDNCIILQVILEMEGYTVECVTSGIEAINQIKLNKPDLLLLDVMMPGLNGFEVVKLLRQDQHLQTLPILLITAYKQMIVPKLTHIKVNKVLHKPVNSDDLVETVHEVLQA